MVRHHVILIFANVYTVVNARK